MCGMFTTFAIQINQMLIPYMDPMGKKTGCRPCLCLFHLHAGERRLSRCVISVQALWWWIPSTTRRGPWGYQVTLFWWICRGILLEGIQMVNPSWLLHTFLLPRDSPINGVGRKGPTTKSLDSCVCLALLQDTLTYKYAYTKVKNPKLGTLAKQTLCLELKKT